MITFRDRLSEVCKVDEIRSIFGDFTDDIRGIMSTSVTPNPFYVFNGFRRTPTHHLEESEV